LTRAASAPNLSDRLSIDDAPGVCKGRATPGAGDYCPQSLSAKEGMGAMTRTDWIALAPVAIVLGLAQTTVGQAPAKKFITPDGKRPTGLFAPGVMVGKTLYIAGKGDYRPNAEFPEKVDNCLNEIKKTLETAGLDLRHVVKSFVYLEDRDKYDEFN